MQNGGFNDFKMEVIEVLPENTDITNRRLKEYEKLKELIESFEDLRAGFDKVLNKHLPIICSVHRLGVKGVEPLVRPTDEGRPL
jgi:hypothetical protein